MSFLVVVVALLLDQVASEFQRLRLHPWYADPLADWARAATGLAAPLQFLAAVAPSFVIAFAVGAISWGLMAANIVLGFIWAALVLLFALGPRNLGVEISAYLRARAAGDPDAARLVATLVIGGEPPGEPAARAREMSDAALVRVGDWLFSALFWFMLLGPLGAALFRAASVIATRAAADQPGTAYAHAASTLKRVMAWVPMHLLALTYAIVGGYTRVSRAMGDLRSEGSPDFLARGSGIAGRAGKAALRNIAASDANEVELLHAVVSLVWRGVMVWLAVIGVIALLEWLF